MRTGAIFARGSCRALKWVALLGMVFALGVGSAAAQPNPPTGVGGSQTAAGTITLSWGSPVAGGDVVTGFQYRQYRPTADPDFTLVTGGSGARSVAVQNLTAGAVYRFELRSVGAGANNFSTVVRTGDLVPINAAPAVEDDDVTGTAGDRQVILKFSGTATNAAPIASYEYRYIEGTSAPDLTAASPPWTNVGSIKQTTVSGLNNGQAYSFAVRARNPVGTGGQGTATGVIPYTVPSAPQSLTAKDPDTGVGVELEWVQPADHGGLAVTRYDYRQDGGAWLSAGGEAANPNRTVTVTGLVAFRTYTFEVRASNESGTGATAVGGVGTAYATVTHVPSGPVTAPTAPLSLTASAGDTQVALSWSAPANDGGSPIKRYEHSHDGGATWTDAKPKLATTAVVTGLTNGTRYTFEVRAVNDIGPGASESVAAVPSVSTVTVKSVAVASSVDEGGRFKVTVTANVPKAAAAGTISSKTVRVTFPTADIAVAEERAEANDTTLLATNAAGTYTWSKIPQKTTASEAKYEFDVAVGRDTDAEDEKFKIAVQIDDAAAKKSSVVTVADAETQSWKLTLPKTITEGAATGAAIKVTPEPLKTHDIPLYLAVTPDPAGYVLDPTNSTVGTAAAAATIKALKDSDRKDATVTVTAYTTTPLGNREELAKGELTAKDIHMLPEIMVQLTDKAGKALSSSTVAEGGEVYLKLSRVRVQDVDRPYTSDEALKVTLSPSSSGTAVAADYNLASATIDIPKGDHTKMSAAVKLEAVADQDVGMETLVLDAKVDGGVAANGPGTEQAGVLTLQITDTTQKQVAAKTQTETDAAFSSAMAAQAGSEGLNPTESFTVDAKDLFTVTAGFTATYTPASSDVGVATVSVTGDQVMISAVSAGTSTITVTARTLPVSSANPTQTVSNTAAVEYTVTVADKAIPTVRAKDGAAEKIAAAIAKAAGSGDWIVGGMVAEVDMEGLFDVDAGVTAIYQGASSDDEVVKAMSSGNRLMLTPMGAGMATITVTGSDTAGGGSDMVTHPATVVLAELTMALTADPMTVDEGGMTMITVTASREVLEETRIELSQASGTAGDDDYDLDHETLVLAAGDTTATAKLTATDDYDVEGNETLTLQGVIGNMIIGSVTVTIEDNDVETTYTLSASAETVEEGGTVTITATASQAVRANTEVKVMRDGASTAGDDDYSLDPPLITIMTGETSGALTLTATDDMNVEGNENLTLNGMVGDMAAGSVMLAITDNDMDITYTLSGPADMNIAEGGSAMLTATASPAVRADTEVMIMRDGSSTASDADFTAESITIKAGETTGTTMVMAVEDNEPDSGSGMPEMLTLYGMVDGMQTNSVTFNIWDAAVPALPVIAQLLLAAFLAVGGYRRYLRR